MRYVKDRSRPERIQFGRPEPVLEAREINHVVDALAPGVVDLELQAVGVALGERRRHTVVDGAADGFIGGVLKLVRVQGIKRTAGGVSASGRAVRTGRT